MDCPLSCYLWAGRMDAAAQSSSVCAGLAVAVQAKQQKSIPRAWRQRCVSFLLPTRKGQQQQQQQQQHSSSMRPSSSWLGNLTCHNLGGALPPPPLPLPPHSTTA